MFELQNLQEKLWSGNLSLESYLQNLELVTINYQLKLEDGVIWKYFIEFVYYVMKTFWVTNITMLWNVRHFIYSATN